MTQAAVLILGVSSGFGAAIARAFAAEGRDIYGVHLDRRSTLVHANQLQAEIQAMGVQAHFFNANAADDEKRREMMDKIKGLLAESRIECSFIHWHLAPWFRLYPTAPTKPMCAENNWK